MSPTDMDAATEILIVAAGAVFTLLVGGALVYWIDREWRALDARHGQQQDAINAARTPDNPDESPTTKPPQS